MLKFGGCGDEGPQRMVLFGELLVSRAKTRLMLAASCCRWSGGGMRLYTPLPCCGAG